MQHPERSPVLSSTSAIASTTIPVRTATTNTSNNNSATPNNAPQVIPVIPPASGTPRTLRPRPIAFVKTTEVHNHTEIPSPQRVQESNEQSTDEEDSEEDPQDYANSAEFPPSKKKIKSTRATTEQYHPIDHACIKCRWRKRNTECQAKMCLSCCVENNQECVQRSHASARTAKDTILFLEKEIKAGKKPKAPLPEPKMINHIPPVNPTILNKPPANTTSTRKPAPTPVNSPAHIPSPPPAAPACNHHVPLLECSDFNSVNSFLAAIQLQQYLPIFMNNGFSTMIAIATLDGSLLDLLGIRALGHRVLLLTAVAQLRQHQQRQHQFRQQ